MTHAFSGTNPNYLAGGGHYQICRLGDLGVNGGDFLQIGFSHPGVLHALGFRTSIAMLFPK
jgi:hypothetical protein